MSWVHTCTCTHTPLPTFVLPLLMALLLLFSPPPPPPELVTVSPMLYSALKVMDEWESIFARRLDALGAAPEDLFHNEEEESRMFKGGPALMRYKFILEPENAPFRLAKPVTRV